MKHCGRQFTSLLFILLLVSIGVGSKVYSALHTSARTKTDICTTLPSGNRLQDWPPAKRQLCGIGVYINSDSAPALTYLPGIGPKRAHAIVQYRTLHGPFHALNDITRINGIGPNTIAQIRPWVEDIR
ncbi:MAG: helix-hairpin-helix domain-containing protein [Deltaproteobacteria bacterium]|nr:helix-hairpin-helix domain-containing protein [Deltaproteobacteria bacterium]MBN2672772.1 helix-hairpin-helix domain-containing protein [Deltaproteobacteria bacterium]